MQKYLMQCREISFQDFEKINPRVAELRGMGDAILFKRTASKTLSEYNSSKWGALLEFVSSSSQITVDDLDEEFLGNELSVFSYHEKIYYGTALLARKISNQVVFDYLDSLSGFDSLVEMGAGYGSVLLGYQRHGKNRGVVKRFVGTDFSESSVSIIKKIGDSSVTESILHDFSTSTKLDIPHGSVVLSHMALMMIPELGRSSIDLLLSIKPKLVINCETIKEDLTNDELGRLRSMYIKANGYNENLWSLLREYEEKGKLKIIDHMKNVYAENCLLPTSVIAWKPL
jgi:hypothetical protein